MYKFTHTFEKHPRLDRVGAGSEERTQGASNTVEIDFFYF